MLNLDYLQLTRLRHWEKPIKWEVGNFSNRIRIAVHLVVSISLKLVESVLDQWLRYMLKMPP